MVLCEDIKLVSDKMQYVLMLFQKQACMAIRNLVARTREYCTEFVNLGVEALLQRTLSKHAECADEAKAALRDLGLNVELKERWTGTGQALHR